MPPVLGSIPLAEKHWVLRWKFHLFNKHYQGSYQALGKEKCEQNPVSALKILWDQQLSKAITAKYCGKAYKSSIFSKYWEHKQTPCSARGIRKC